MWISNDFMQTFMQITKFISTGFLIYQAMMMLIVAYKINDQVERIRFEKDSASCGDFDIKVVIEQFVGVNRYFASTVNRYLVPCIHCIWRHCV